jgi:hypothetical protein
MLTPQQPKSESVCQSTASERQRSTVADQENSRKTDPLTQVLK